MDLRKFLALKCIRRIPNPEKAYRPDVPGFEYWICVGYDAGDLYYDDPSNLEELRNIFEKRISGPLRSEGVVARVVFIRWGDLRVWVFGFRVEGLGLSEWYQILEIKWC